MRFAAFVVFGEHAVEFLFSHAHSNRVDRLEQRVAADVVRQFGQKLRAVQKVHFLQHLLIHVQNTCNLK